MIFFKKKKQIKIEKIKQRVCPKCEENITELWDQKCYKCDKLSKVDIHDELHSEANYIYYYEINHGSKWYINARNKVISKIDKANKKFNAEREKQSA